MIQTKEMLEKWVKLNGARPGDDKILGKLLPKPKKPILSGGVESRHATQRSGGLPTFNSPKEIVAAASLVQRPDEQTHSGSSAPPAQSSSQKEAARKKRWQQKNKKKLAAYQKKWRARQ